MAKITCILAANICRQFFFVINTAASTRCLAANFQLICYSQPVNAASQYNDSLVQDVQNDRTIGWLRGETLVVPCTRKKRLQRKMTKDYYWTGVQENIGMLSKSYSDCNSLI